MIIKLFESSPDTISGSMSKDLGMSKLWMFDKLKSFGLDEFNRIYILGSWYGGINLFLLSSKLKFDFCINVELSYEKVQHIEHFIKRMKLGDRIGAVYADANDLEYSGEPMLIINTSTNDIEGRDWFDNIPSGTACVFQGKDHQEFGGNGIDTVKKFDLAYPLSKTLYLGHLPLEDVHGDPYLRFMKIGLK